MSSAMRNLPMLSPYLLGEMMSSHNGVRCYPAIRRGTEEKYILKVISVPDNPSRLDALLLTGAMPSKMAALDYFMTLSEDVLRQTDILRSLSQQEGFVPYLDSQIMAKEDESGFEVYLLGTYRHSLERIQRTELLTHADAANLGLDLCAALAACRRTGYLYVDLKPGNIFRDPEQGFRIGDVGFISLQSLQYASLPEKYRSSYTAPEMHDDMAVLNATVDIYALGLVLYQVYNGGVLPFMGQAPAEILPPPIYADYEMAQIILKACHPDPSERWQEPTKMAHALIDYLQTYGAPEAPIIPPVMDKPQEEEAEEPFLPEDDPEQLRREMDDLENAYPDELAFLSGLVSDETAPNEENTADVPDEVMTQELSEMFAQADELICHPLPEPPVAPEPVFAPMPEPIRFEEEAEVPAPVAPDPVEAEQAPEEDVPAPEEAAPEQLAQPAPSSLEAGPDPLRVGPIVRRLIVAAMLVLVALSGWFFGRKHYDDFYLLNVDALVLQQEKDTVTVQVISKIDQQLLTVVCTDTYGNSTSSAVKDGIAVFTDLNPNTRYTVRVEVSGWHKLLGTTTENFTTPAQTQIFSFTAGIGPEDGSVQLNFAVSGPEGGNWTVLYGAEGIPEQSMDFTGRSTVVTGLVPGALYTFTLASPDGLYLAGQTQVQFLATKILYAQNLTITACGGGSLSLQWAQPEGEAVEAWRVRCYDEAGYNVTVTTSDLFYTFTGLDHSTACTVEVTAVGMNRGTSTSIRANPVTVDLFSCGLNGIALQAAWQFSGEAPAGGWILRYRVDGGPELALPLAEPMANILAIPGATYAFILEAADGSHVFNNAHCYTDLALPMFSGHGITAADMVWSLFQWPENDCRRPEDIPAENFKAEFMTGNQAGFLIRIGVQPEDSDDSLHIQYVLHDSNCQVVDIQNAHPIWGNLWQDGYCLLPIPTLPDQAGSYTMAIYFDGSFVYRQDLTVVEAPVDEPEEPLAN